MLLEIYINKSQFGNLYFLEFQELFLKQETELLDEPLKLLSGYPQNNMINDS